MTDPNRISDDQHNNAPAVPQGYEIHEIPADYSGPAWLEGRVRAVARRAQAATGPQGWTDADSDAARLALELECLLMDTKDLSVVSKWWGSANDALELHRQRLAATPAPVPAQGEPFGYFRAEPFGWTDCSEDADGAIALYEHPAQPAQEVGLTDGEPAHVAGLLEQRRELDAIEFFESTNRDSYGFKKSVRGIYVNPDVARDWKWFQLGMKHATEDES